MPPAPSGAHQPRSRPSQGRATRIFCPVAGCPCADAARAPGWKSNQTMLPHINGHLAKGDVQAVQEWMNDQNKTHCRVCGLCVAISRGVHPTCRPLERASLNRGRSGDPEDADEAGDDAHGATAVLPPGRSHVAQNACSQTHPEGVQTCVGSSLVPGPSEGERTQHYGGLDRVPNAA